MKYKSTSYLSCLMRVISIALVFATSTLVSTAQNGWQRITDQEAGFTTSFPGRPEYGESTAPETGQPLETYSFYYNGNLLHIAFGPMVPAPRTAMQVNRALSDTADVYARNAGNLLRQEKLPDGGRQFDNIVKTPSGTLHLRSRIYIHRGMIFTLSCGSYAQDGIDEQIAERFFSSFSFTSDAPRRQVSARRTAPKKSSPKVADRMRWHVLRGPNADFIAEFPGKPDYNIDTSASPPLHTYRFAYGENFFAVSYRERSQPGASPEQELKQALKNYHAALPWLEAHQPPPFKRTESSRKVDWATRDAQLAKEVRLAAKQIRSTEGRPVRIMVNVIGRHLDKTALLTNKKLIVKMPLTAQTLSELVETHLVFTIRSIRWAASCCRHEDIIPTLTALAKRAGTTTATTHKPEIRAVINEELESLRNASDVPGIKAA